MSEERDDEIISEEVLYEKIDHYLQTDRCFVCLSWMGFSPH